MSDESLQPTAGRWNDPAREAERQARHVVLIDLLGAYVDGELPPETASQLDAHLVGCARCRREVQLQLALRAQLSAAPVEPASPILRQRLADALAATVQTPAPPAGGRVSRRWVGLAAMVALVAAIVVVVVSLSTSLRGDAAVAALGVPAAEVPLLAGVVSDYRRVAAADLPGPARDLASVRAATGLPVEPMAGAALRLLGAWTTTIDGEAIAVLAYRWDDRTIVQYIVPDALFFRHAALRAAAAGHRAVSANVGDVGLVAWPIADAGAILVGDGSGERLAGALVR